MKKDKAEKSRRDEYSEATRQALIEAAREIFAAEGFQTAALEAISRAARVTRGALYHHFDDKKALFDAVIVAMQAEAASRIETVAKSQPSLWDRLQRASTPIWTSVSSQPTGGS